MCIEIEGLKNNKSNFIKEKKKFQKKVISMKKKR